jgi:hypothetical protein
LVNILTGVVPIIDPVYNITVTEALTCQNCEGRTCLSGQNCGQTLPPIINNYNLTFTDFFPITISVGYIFKI